MQCTECGTRIVLPVSPKITTVTCSRCGDVSMRSDGDTWRRMYPALSMYGYEELRVNELPVESRWMPTRTRPVRAGTYACRFRTTEPEVLKLHWDGVCFRNRAGGVRVHMTEFLSWRGVLA